jgi:hypothetical protein
MSCTVSPSTNRPYGLLRVAQVWRCEGYRKIWARLRFADIRTSKRRVLSLTREHALQAPQRAGRTAPRPTTA